RVSPAAPSPALSSSPPLASDLYVQLPMLHSRPHALPRVVGRPVLPLMTPCSRLFFLLPTSDFLLPTSYFLLPGSRFPVPGSPFFLTPPRRQGLGVTSRRHGREADWTRRSRRSHGGHGVFRDLRG